MEKLPSVKALLGAVIAISLIGILIFSYERVTKLRFQSDVSTLGSYLNQNSKRQVTMMLTNLDEPKEEQIEVIQSVLEIPLALKVVPEVVYEGMTIEELGAKLDRSLKSTISGYGAIFAQKSLEYGVDPYVAVAIVLLETGCYSGVCSTLTTQCYNVGGMKGSPGCGEGSYKMFSSLEEGIDAFLKNLSYNYYKKGLTTVEQIGKKYAESKTWSTKIYNYISKIKVN